MNIMRKSKILFLGLITAIALCFTSPGLSQVTTPEEYLGYRPGDNFRLATYEQWLEYFELLASQTDRLQMFDMGSTSMGRQMKYAVISSEENITDLERYRDITKRLSLALVDSKEEAAGLAEEGKSVVWIDGGIHSTETSPTMHQFQLAYDLVTGNDKRTRYIRENVILLLLIANPDGMTMVTDWYMKNVGTVYETSPLPELYNKYAGHDNNRDSFMANLLETQNMNRLAGTIWYPELLYVQHESAPFPARIWIPPNPEPVNPNMHPIIVRWKNLIGSAMAQSFEAEDKKGVISRTAFDLWYPGYADGSSVEGHNITSILTETANYRYATPHFYTVNDFPEDYRDMTMGTFYTSPWDGGWWRFADAVEYNLTASKSLLEAAAKYRYELLYYKYKMAHDIKEKFKSQPPYGWIIPPDQHDPNTTSLLLERLMDYDIVIHKANEDFNYEGIDFPAGSNIIRTSQPFGMYVKNLFEKQEYPDLRNYGHLWQGVSRIIRFDGQPMAPYDGVGWTLPVQMGVRTVEMSSLLEIDETKMEMSEFPEGTVNGNGRHYIFPPNENNSFIALNNILRAGGVVSRSLEEFSSGGVTYPEGSFLVNSSSIQMDDLRKIALDSRVSMQGGNANVGLNQIRRPRLALYKSWVANMDAGWISLILERYGFSFYPLTDADIKAGDLSERFEVIILPDQSPSSMINGHRKGTMPPDYVGGMTIAGVENLKSFVEDGGILICNNGSSGLPIASFDLPVKNILQDVPADSFNSPGSLLKIAYDSEHRLTYGIPSSGMAYFSRGRAFEIESAGKNSDESISSQTVKVVARYPDKPLLISGWLSGEDKIRNKAAIVEIPFKKGKIILFGFNVHNRMQAYSTFKLLFNAIYLK